MIAATSPIQRPRGAKLLVVRADGELVHAPRSSFVEFLSRGDLVIANDAATLPASLHAVHLRSGRTIEVRLAGHLPPVSCRRAALRVRFKITRSAALQGCPRGGCRPKGLRYMSPRAILKRTLKGCATSAIRFVAVVFGEGDYRTRTEDRPPPPALAAGDRLALGSLVATVDTLLDHPRLLSLHFEGCSSEVWAGLARHGRPIQYAHLAEPLAMWDVWTPIASVPVAFEPPSAGFALDWAALRALRDRGIDFATLTHAAGISSTGDPELDRRLPFDEPYEIPRATAAAIRRARARGGRVVAVGTTVVRALEHAARRRGGIRAGRGVATGRLGPSTCLRVVDAILSGTHEPDSSHYQLLRAFADDDTLARASAALEAGGYLTHEFGDSMLVERTRPACADAPACYWLSNSPSTLPSVSAMRP